MKSFLQSKINNIILGSLLFGMTHVFLYADVPKSKKNTTVTKNALSKMIDSTETFKYNNIYTDMTNNGLIIDYHISGDMGMKIRKSNTAIAAQGTIFQTSLWMTGEKNGELVAVVADYTQDMGPGPWGGDPLASDVRIYTVDIDMLAQPELFTDFQNWPTDHGAPWVDVDGDGVYSPLPAGVDHPKFYGDQVSYYVSNDGDPAYKLNFNTAPMDFEFQTTVYGFHRPTQAPKYSNTVFYRILVINKGTEAVENTYMGLWVDPDLGNASDDFVGVDVNKSMGYVWNDGADSEITNFFDGDNNNLAVGFDLFQGPMVDCTANEFVDITLLGSDADGDILAYNVGTPPSNGDTSFLSQNVIRYTPNTNFSGTDTFTYTATDGILQSPEATVTITVIDGGGSSNSPSITLPNGSESWKRGSTYDITWTNGFTNTGIDLYKGNTKVLDVAGDVGSVNSFSWTIPSDLAIGTDYRIRVYDAGAGEEEDYSNNYFTITNTSGRSDYHQILTSNLNDTSLQYQNEIITAMQNFDHTHYEDENGIVRCGTDQFEQELQLLYPELINEREKFLNQVNLNKELIDFSRTTTIKIPVIFHVLYNQASENISASLIGENFDQLNLDFQTTNPDTSKVPNNTNPSDATTDPGIDYNHYSAIGSHDVQFIGFNGETSGSALQENISIRRYNMSQENVSSVDEARQLIDSITPDSGAVGGYQEGYFNVYISPLSGGLLGMASFDIPHTVIKTSTVGSVNNPNTSTSSSFNLGRTLTHEVGHNFGYYHTFQHSTCSDTANMSDIPVQINPNQGGASLYQINGSWYGGGAQNDCISTTGKGEQFMNYMDYSADVDLVMFSNEQSKQGYAWAYTYDWAVNQAPSVIDISVTATVNESCGLGAQMFNEYHPTKKNLPLSSFAFYINGDATYTDPSNATEARNYMLGLRKDGSAYPNEIAGDLYNQKFAFYGDPNVSHSTANPVDGNYASSADRRFAMGVGPFNMAVNDSQEVVFAAIHSFGANALAAVDSLKSDDTTIQSDYDNRFSVLKYVGATNVNLSSSITSGYAPLNVIFDGSNSTPADYFYWDFDNDGTTDSKSISPTYTFNSPGEFKVKLDVKYKDFVDGYSTMSVASDSVTISVLSPSPTVQDVSYTVNEDTAETITLVGADPQDKSLTFRIIQNPSHASHNLSGSTLTYTPNENFVGEDSLKYVANNGTYDSNIGKITIQVSAVDDDPTTYDVSVTTNEDTAVDISLSAEEYDGDSYSFGIIQSPAYGTLSDVSGSTVTYTPNSHWFGVDKFTYEATDDRFSKTNIATAAITVNPVNDAPTTNDMTIDSYEDQATTITLDVNDMDGDNLSVTNTDPINGVISAKAGNLFTYTPNENYNGSDAFTYYVNDGELDSNTSTISIALSPVNDASSEFTVSEEYKVNSSSGDEWIITTNNLIATPQNEQDSLQFNWEESFDIDGDQIQYRMIGYDALEFLTMDSWITDLTLSWSIKDLVSYTDTVNVASGSWVIVATDGEFFKESNFGNPMELFINGSALVPDTYTLNQNYPNPFSSSTTITYDMPETQKVMIRIFDIKGRLIRTLANEDQNAGYKTVIWDGKNDDGDQVSAGIYFYQMHAPSSLNFNGLTTTKKMIKLD